MGRTPGRPLAVRGRDRVSAPGSTRMPGKRTSKV